MLRRILALCGISIAVVFAQNAGRGGRGGAPAPPPEPGTAKERQLWAYDRCGSGPVLIVVDGALCSRAFGPSAKLATALSDSFSVYTYDRRGRGQSSDTMPYSTPREVEDLGDERE